MINPETIIAEKSYIEDVKKSINSKPTESAKKKNNKALELLRKARKG